MSCSQCYQLTSLDRDAPKNGLVLLQSFMCHFSSYLFYIGIFPRKFETLANSQLVFNFFSFRNQGCSHHYFLICYRLRKKDGKESPSQDLIEGWFFNSFFFRDTKSQSLYNSYIGNRNAEVWDGFLSSLKNKLCSRRI